VVLQKSTTPGNTAALPAKTVAVSVICVPALMEREGATKREVVVDEGAAGIIVVGSEELSFETFDSPPPLTLATFVTEAGALLATLTVTLAAG